MPRSGWHGSPPPVFLEALQTHRLLSRGAAKSAPSAHAEAVAPSAPRPTWVESHQGCAARWRRRPCRYTIRPIAIAPGSPTVCREGEPISSPALHPVFPRHATFRPLQKWLLREMMNLAPQPVPRRAAVRRPIDASWQRLARARTLPLKDRAAWNPRATPARPLAVSRSPELRQALRQPRTTLYPPDCRRRGLPDGQRPPPVRLPVTASLPPSTPARFLRAMTGKTKSTIRSKRFSAPVSYIVG